MGINSFLNLIKKTPILNFKRLPNPRRNLHRTLNKLPLLPHFHINLLLRILPLDMRHVNGDQDISTLPLQPDKRQHNSREIRALGVWRRRRRLRRDERIGWYAFSIYISRDY